MAGAVAIDPSSAALAGGSDRHDRQQAERRRVRVTLSSRRDRLTAIGRRRSDVAKTELYWGARRWRANRQKIFVSESESERVSGSLDSQRAW